MLPGKPVPAEPGNLEAERMTTTTANVFSPFAPNFVDLNEVAQHDTRQRVPDYADIFFWFNERVAAPARVFGSR